MLLDEPHKTLLEDALLVGLIEWWGSDCDSCGNTTPDSMRCSECKSTEWTRPLFIVGEPLCDPPRPCSRYPRPRRQAIESVDARRTRRRRELLAAGTHPTTRLPLRQPVGEVKCGDCVHHFAYRASATYHKCDAVELTHGPGSDVRVSWPACTKFEPRQPGGLPDA